MTDAKHYYGREKVVDELRAQVAKTNFVAVVGSSGCGKSSLAYAGLANTLLHMKEQGVGHWECVGFRPLNAPLFYLSHTLVELFERGLDSFEKFAKASQWSKWLANGKVGVDEPLDKLLDIWRDQHIDVAHVLLIVDQFEEVFHQCPDADERQAFFRILVKLTTSNWIKVVLTVRINDLGHVLDEPLLGAAVKDSVVYVANMTPEELRQAVERPALETGRRFDPGLVERILYEVGRAPSRLPLLQFALTSLWAAQTVDGLLSAAAYEELGGVEQAISRHAESIYSEEADQKEHMRHLFRRLVRVTYLHDGGDDTRQRICLADLPLPQQQLVQKLAAERVRLLVTNSDPTTGSPTVEIAHEALIRHWTRLREWLDTDREFLLWLQRFRLDLERWERSERTDTDLLLRGVLLAEAERWLQNKSEHNWTQNEQNYVAVSIDQRQAVEDARIAEEARLHQALATARRNLRVAVARELATFALNEVARREDPSGSLALILARTAVLTTLTPDGIAVVEAQDALQQAIDASPPWKMTLPRLHTGRVVCVALSPNGEFLATASADDTFRLWSTITGCLLKVIKGQWHTVYSVAFSPDNRQLVTASRDRTVRIWDIQTGEELICIGPLQKCMRSAVFNASGTCILTTGDDGWIRLYNINGKIISSFRGHDAGVRSAIFSMSGKIILSASEDHTVRLWDSETGKEIQQMVGHTAAVSSVAFHPSETIVASASEDCTARLWDTVTGEEIGQLNGHQKAVWSIAFSSKGDYLITGSEDGKALIWDVATRSRICQLDTPPHREVLHAVFNSKDTLIATAHGDDTARLWHFPPTTWCHQIQGHESKFKWAAFSPDNQYIVTAGSDQTVRLWDASTTKEVRQFPKLKDPPFHVTFSPDGKTIAASSVRVVYLWNIDTGDEVLQLRGHYESVFSADFRWDGRLIVTASVDGTTRIWDVETGKELYQLRGHKGRVHSAVFSPDGTSILTAGSDFSVRLWDATTGSEMHKFHGHTNFVFSAVFSPDGKTIASAGYDRVPRVWDVGSRVEICQLTGHSDWIWCIAFSPDGKTVVTASADTTARIWSAETGIELRQLKGHQQGVSSCAFNSRGDRVVTTSGDNTARIWFAHIEDLLAEAALLIQRDPPELKLEERRRFLHEG